MTAPTEIFDTLVHAGWILPVAPAGAVLPDHSLAVQDGRIVAIMPQSQGRALRARETFDLPGHALLPGLINSHGHAAMSLLRGYADDLPLMPWLEEHIWPAEGRHVGEDFVAVGVELAIAEMVRAGTTTFSDMYFFPDICARVAQASRIRCQLVFPILDFPTAWARDADEYISKGLALRDDVKHSELVTVGFGPHAPYTVNKDNLGKVATLAAELDTPVQIHLHETTGEVLQAVEQHGERPLNTLYELGLLGPRTQCVHMTDLGDQDIALLAYTGAHVIHCPQSNLKLAAGICPVSKLLDAGVNVALGTDSAASNNNLNLFAEMRAAALLAKFRSGDASTLPASSVLAMATIGGARALGLEEQTGSLEPGKRADMIAVNLSGPETQPVHNALSQVVYACNGSQVSHNWVGGDLLLRDGELQYTDLSSLGARAAAWQARIAGTGSAS